MRRIFTLLLSFIMILTLSACGVKKEASVDDIPAKTDEGPLYTEPETKRTYGKDALEDAVLRFMPYEDGYEDSFCILMFDDNSVLFVKGDRKTNDITSDDIMKTVVSEQHIIPCERKLNEILDAVEKTKEHCVDMRTAIADATLVQVYVDGEVYSGRFSKDYPRVSANGLDRLNFAFWELFGYEINTPGFS